MMSKEAINLHVTVAAIIEKDQKFLLVEEVINGKKVLNQPAGHVEGGESFIDAVIRETMEETAWQFLPEAITGIYRWTIPNTNETFFRHCFTGKVTVFNATQELDKGIIQTLWLSQDELRQRQSQLRSPLVLKCISDYLDGQRYNLNLYSDIP